jgi:hypothetical protein
MACVCSPSSGLVSVLGIRHTVRARLLDILLHTYGVLTVRGRRAIRSHSLDATPSSEYRWPVFARLPPRIRRCSESATLYAHARVLDIIFFIHMVSHDIVPCEEGEQLEAIL